MDFLIRLFQLIVAIISAIAGQVLVINITARLSYSLYAQSPLTPWSRVSHLICNSDDGLEHTVNRFLILTLFGVMLLHNEGRPFLIVFLLIGAVLIGAMIRSGVRAGHRKAIAEQILKEQQRWDSEHENPKVFVIKRDTMPDAVELYDLITLACYESGISVLQYTDFKWPDYHHYLTGTGNPAVGRVPNPGAVAIADAVLWLDIGEQSKAMKSELDEARKLDRMIIRLAYCLGSGKDFMLESESGILTRVPKTEVPRCVRDLFHQFFISQQVRQLDTPKWTQLDLIPTIPEEGMNKDREG